MDEALAKIDRERGTEIMILSAGKTEHLSARQLEGVSHGAYFGIKVGMGYGYLAILMTALLFVRYLIFNLDAAGAGFDQFFSQ